MNSFLFQYSDGRYTAVWGYVHWTLLYFHCKYSSFIVFPCSLQR